MAIVRTTVAEDDRMNFLPAKTGPGLSIMFEASIYATLAGLTNGQYQGALWEFYNLDNGGWYMAPLLDGSLSLTVETNGYSGMMSDDAAGIVATLFAMNGALHHAPLAVKEARYLTNAYYALKDYACEHAEAAEILGAID